MPSAKAIHSPKTKDSLHLHRSDAYGNKEIYPLKNNSLIEIGRN